MAEKEYTVIAPDGKEVTIIGPEGASQQEVIAQAQRLYKPSSSAPEAKERGLMETMFGFGSPTQRLVKGAVVDPFWGAAKLLTGGQIDIVNEMAKSSEEATQRGRQERGSEGFDWMQLAGNVVSPINRVLPVQGATALGTTAKAAGSGAVIGGLQPATEGTGVDQAAQQIKNMIVSGVFGGAVGGAIAGGSKLVDFLKEAVKPFSKTGQDQILWEKLKDVIPDSVRNEVIKKARTAEEFVPGSKPTVAEATADVPEAVRLAAYQRVLEKEGMAPEFFARREAQRTARRGAVQEVGGTPDDIRAATAARTAETAPIREEALSGANVYGQTSPAIEDAIAEATRKKIQALQVGGKLSTEAAEQTVLSQTRPPVLGMPRVSPKYTPNFDRIYENLQGAREAGNKAGQQQAEKAFQQFQLNSLAERGFYPLEASPIIANIDKVLRTPGQRASTLVQDSLGSLRNKLTSLIDERGIINSNDLYTIRKEIGTDIERFLPPSAVQSGKWDKSMVAGLEKSLQKSIDDAITGAGGTRWKEYLSSYSQASNKIDQLKIGQYLEQKLGTALASKENAGAFVKAMENQSKTIQKATGQSKEQLSDVLTASQLNRLEGITKDLVRSEAAKVAGRGARVDLNLVGKEGHQLPQFLSTSATVMNALLRHFRGDANSQINQKFSRLLLNTDEFANFVSKFGEKDAEILLKAFNKSLNPSVWNTLQQKVSPMSLDVSGERLGTIIPGATYSQETKPVPRKSVFPQNQQQRLFNQPQSKNDLQRLVSAIIQQKNVPPELARVIPAVIQTESSWNPTASNKNSSAKGLFQMTNAARADVGIPRNATVQQDIEGGIDYLLKQYRKYGNVRQAIQAYNQGHYNPKSKEGRQYVATVMGNL